MDIDSYQDKIGGVSTYQLLAIAAVGFISFGVDFTSEAAVFISAVPDYRCAIPTIDGDVDKCNLTEEEIKNLTIPFDDKGYSSCSRYAYNMSACAKCDVTCIKNQENCSTTTCDFGYVYDDSIYEETTTTQFNLVCDRRYLDTIAQTLFFMGFFIGSALVGPLCDWFGRRKAMLISTVSFVGCSVGVAFSPSYEAFVITRVLAGACIIVTFIAAFTYVCEIASTKRRTAAAAWLYFNTGAAHTVFAGIAYFIRDWRYLQLSISLLPGLYVVLYFIIPETPRWLLANGRTEEARKVVSRYAKSKGKILTDEDWALIVETENKKLDQSKEDSSRKVRVWDLFRRPLMRILCLNVMFSWFTVSLVFYGLALNGGNLAGDPYLNNALNGLVEVFASSSMYVAVIFGRVPVLTGGFISAGVFCIASMLCDLFSFGHEGLLTTSTVFAICGKFFASTAFGVLYSVTSEIFPTNARATGMSVGSMAARVGGMLSPLVLAVQMSIPWFTQTVFGILTIFAGIFSLIFPETGKTDYITTMDEAEEYYRNNMKILKLFNKTKSSNINECYDNPNYVAEKGVNDSC